MVLCRPVKTKPSLEDSVNRFSLWCIPYDDDTVSLLDNLPVPIFNRTHLLLLDIIFFTRLWVNLTHFILLLWFGLVFRLGQIIDEFPCQLTLYSILEVWAYEHRLLHSMLDAHTQSSLLLDRFGCAHCTYGEHLYCLKDRIV